MSKANKCDRCGTCFDPMSGNGQNEMAFFGNPAFYTSENAKNMTVGRYLMDDAKPDAQIDLCPACARDFEKFMKTWMTPVPAPKYDPKPMVEPDETDGTDRILFEDKRDADKVLTLLKDLIRTYGSATRMDLNEFAQTSNFNSKFIDSLYGWRNLDDAKVIGTFNDKKEPVWQLTLPWAQLLTDKQQGGDFDGDD